MRGQGATECGGGCTRAWHAMDDMAGRVVGRWCRRPGYQPLGQPVHHCTAAGTHGVWGASAPQGTQNCSRWALVTSNKLSPALAHPLHAFSRTTQPGMCLSTRTCYSPWQRRRGTLLSHAGRQQRLSALLSYPNCLAVARRSSLMTWSSGSSPAPGTASSTGAPRASASRTATSTASASAPSARSWRPWAGAAPACERYGTWLLAALRLTRWHVPCRTHPAQAGMHVACLGGGNAGAGGIRDMGVRLERTPIPPHHSPEI